MTRKYTEKQHKEWFNSQPRKPMSAAVLLPDIDGKLLIVKPNYRDTWNLPGGTVGEHESPLSAAVREVREELGIKIDPSRLQFRAVDYRPAKDGLTDKLYFYFLGNVLDASTISHIKLQKSELDDMRFVDKDEAKLLTSEWTYRQIRNSLASIHGGLYMEKGLPTNERT